MGDPRRFDEFAKLVAKHVPTNARIFDVASGRGCLQAALHQLGYRNVLSWDKRKRNATRRAGYRYGYFDHTTRAECDAVVAMHPDEATDHAVLYAVERGVKAIVCPCCVKPSAATYLGGGDRKSWHAWLDRLCGSAPHFWTKIPIAGCNDVLVIN